MDSYFPNLVTENAILAWSEDSSYVHNYVYYNFYIQVHIIFYNT